MDAVNSTLTISFAAGVYDVEAIKRAAYRFIDRVSIDIRPSEGSFECALSPLAKRKDLDLHEVGQEFRNEVLDHDLRLKIAKETEPYRNLILGLAFSKTGLAE